MVKLAVTVGVPAVVEKLLVTVAVKLYGSSVAVAFTLVDKIKFDEVVPETVATQLLPLCV